MIIFLSKFGSKLPFLGENIFKIINSGPTVRIISQKSHQICGAALPICFSGMEENLEVRVHLQTGDDLVNELDQWSAEIFLAHLWSIFLNLLLP
jgi:predicted FMN-binding regulatory protein PaiB